MPAKLPLDAIKWRFKNNDYTPGNQLCKLNTVNYRTRKTLKLCGHYQTVNESTSREGKATPVIEQGNKLNITQKFLLFELPIFSQISICYKTRESSRLANIHFPFQFLIERYIMHIWALKTKLFHLTATKHKTIICPWASQCTENWSWTNVSKVTLRCSQVNKRTNNHKITKIETGKLAPTHW